MNGSSSSVSTSRSKCDTYLQKQKRRKILSSVQRSRSRFINVCRPDCNKTRYNVCSLREVSRCVEDPSEFIACCEGTKEAIWFRQLVNSTGKNRSTSTIISVDNNSAISRIKSYSRMHPDKTKHINVK